MPLDLTKFDDFIKLTKKGGDLSRFRDNYAHMADLNGAVPCLVVGFEFDFEDETMNSPEERSALARDIFETFSPGIIYVGNEDMCEKVRALGRSPTLFSFFEYSGFAVVLKVPLLSHIELSEKAFIRA